MQDLANQVSEVISKRLGTGPVHDKSEWEEHFKTLDSLDMMDLIFDIENKFNIKVNAEAHIKNFDDLVQVVADEKKKALVS